MFLDERLRPSLTAQLGYYVNNKVSDQRNAGISSPNKNESIAKMAAGSGPVGAVGTVLESMDSFGSSLYDQHFNQAFMDGDYSFVSFFYFFLLVFLLWIIFFVFWFSCFLEVFTPLLASLNVIFSLILKS